MGSNGAAVGTVSFDGRLRITVPVEVATGALCEVLRLRFERAPVLKPPLTSGGDTCRYCPVALTTLPWLSS